ncbi:MAG: hypothetical protein JRK53_04860 [Deltaproteobacteria bacterium]|nr:hypothetical protein [Deltaproteobacteria bacterium]MBW1816983.1 hypothetical protein [Deltaproteobacteria bacterium]
MDNRVRNLKSVIKKQLRGQNKSPIRAGVQLGDLYCFVESTDAALLDSLAAAYGTPLLDVEHENPEGVGCTIRVFEREESSPDLPPDGMKIQNCDGRWLVDSPYLACTLDRNHTPPRVTLHLRQPDLAHHLKIYVLWLTLNKVLLLMNRLLLHAAAVKFQGRVILFAGRRGTGKSTVSLALAKQGAVVLAEDHIIAYGADGGIQVSGCNARFRVMPDAEAYLFGNSLKAPVVDVGGVLKKEGNLYDHVKCAPNRAFRPDALCFNVLGSNLALRRIKPQEAVRRIMANTRDVQRFSGGEDFGRYLRLVSELAKALPVYELELSKELEELAELESCLEPIMSRR